MQRVHEGSEHIWVFIDDILCLQFEGAEHVQDLSRFLERLAKFDVKLAPRKAFLGVRAIKFLGYRVAADGLAPDPGKAKALHGLPTPKNVSQL